MTWSIVAFDKDTGAFGVTVATQAFACGGFMPSVRAGVGAVCSQSLTNPYLGPAVLDAMARGLSAELAIASAIAGDEGRAVRQLHAVDARGRAFAWTGRHCVEWAGSVTASGVSVAGNMLSNAKVAQATLDGFHADATAPLPERMMAAMDGGEAAGGDRRGRQSAAMLMATTEDFPTLNLRVDSHDDPFAELRRLLHIWRTTRAPHAHNSPSKANPAGVHDLDTVEANWAKMGLHLKFRR